MVRTNAPSIAEAIGDLYRTVTPTLPPAPEAIKLLRERDGLSPEDAGRAVDALTRSRIQD